MSIALIIILILVLAALGGLVVFASARRRDTDVAIGQLSRETRKRDQSAVPVLVGAPGHGPRGREVRGPRAPSPEIERAATTDLADYVAPDPEQLGVTRRQFLNRSILTFMGLSLAAFGAAVLGFLWPVPKGGFGSKIQVGKVTDLLSQISQQGGFLYFAQGRLWMTAYPSAALQKAQKVYSPAGAQLARGRHHRRVPDLPAPGLPRAVVRDVAVVRVPVPRLAVQPGR